MTEILTTMPLRAALSSYGPPWARAAIIAWSPKAPDIEYLVGWQKGARGGVKALHRAAASFSLTRHLADPAAAREARLISLEQGEHAIADRDDPPTTFLYSVRVAGILDLTPGERPVKIAEAANRWREVQEKKREDEPAGPVAVEVRLNEALRGVELRMSRKPEAAKRFRLIRDRWRWSNWSKCWWRSDGPEARESAEAIREDFARG